MSDSNINYLTVMNNILYFQANNGVDGIELWRSDGTTAGTYIVKNINPTGDAFPDGFTVLNGVLYFQATTDEYGSEVWCTDGTEDGTYLAVNVDEGDAGQAIQLLAVHNGILFLCGYNIPYGRELYLF